MDDKLSSFGLHIPGSRLIAYIEYLSKVVFYLHFVGHFECVTAFTPSVIFIAWQFAAAFTPSLSIISTQFIIGCSHSFGLQWTRYLEGEGAVEIETGWLRFTIGLLKVAAFIIELEVEIKYHSQATTRTITTTTAATVVVTARNYCKESNFEFQTANFTVPLQDFQEQAKV